MALVHPNAPFGAGKHRHDKNRRLILPLVVIAAVLCIPLTPTPAYADELYFRLKDVEIKYLGLWEEPAIASFYGQPAHTADVWVEVQIYAAKKLKLGIYDQVNNSWLATTVYTASGPGTYLWQPTITVPLQEQSLGVYAYYWKASTSTYVQDDVAFGWTPVHSQQNFQPIGTWGPNQYSLPTNARSGDWAVFQQYFWYWDNSYYTSQNVGSDHRARLLWWADRTAARRLTIEFRRLTDPLNDGVGQDANKEGWDFGTITCVLFVCWVSGHYDWESDIWYSRVSDVEEIGAGGDEEAQFEVDADDVQWSFGVVNAQEPEVRYGNMNYVWAQFYRKPGYAGDPVYVLTGIDLQDAGVPFSTYSKDYLSYIRTGF